MTVVRTGCRAVSGMLMLLLVSLAGGAGNEPAGVEAAGVTGKASPSAAPRTSLEPPTGCRTAPGLKARRWERHLLRGLPAPERLSPSRRATAASGSVQLLGADGNLEKGSVVEMDGVIILVDDGTGVTGTFQTGFSLDTFRLAHEYYAALPDRADVLSFLPNFDHEDGTFQLLVQNTVQGINRPSHLDDTAIFGSAGRLQSLQLFANFVRRPLDPEKRPPGDNDSTLSLLAHEFAHQFGTFVRVDADPRPEVVAPQDILLGRKKSHWCFFMDTSSAFGFPGGRSTGMSSLEGNRWRQAAGGSFTTAGQTDGYSPLDLYLMGFMDASEVPPFFLLENPQPASPGCDASPRSVPGMASVTVQAGRRTFSIDDIISVEGPRLPDVTTSQKNFRQELVIVARQGQFPAPDEVARVAQLRRDWEAYFAAATGGRGSVSTAENQPPGPARTFAFVRLPEVLQAGRPFRAGLLVLDENGRVATDYQGHVILSSSDSGAMLPADIIFDATHQGYQVLDAPISFAVGGLSSLTAADRDDPTITGTRTGLVVENPSVNLCVPGPPDPLSTTVRPWGIGRAFSERSGVRYQYLIKASSIGRPALVTDLNWQVNGGPDAVQWENLVIKMGHKPVYQLENQAGEVALNSNLAQSTDVTQVHAGRLEQVGMMNAGRLHVRLSIPFTYNGIDNLLLEIRYSGGGPAGLLTDEVQLGGEMIFLERLGPNLPVPRSLASTVCIGARPASGPPPSISSVKVEDLNNTSATLAWRTSPSTNGWVLVGKAGSALDRMITPQRLSFSHRILVDLLQPGIPYEAIAVSQDVDAQITRSAPVSFTTTNVRPSISRIIPGSLPVDTSHGPAQIRGAHFFAGVQVEIISALDPPQPDPLIHVLATSLVSDSVLNLALSISPDSEPGPRRIRMTNPDGIEVVSPFFFGVEPAIAAGDVDASGRVDGFDLLRLARAFGQRFPSPLFDPSVDLNGDGDIDGLDLARLAQIFGRDL